MQKYCSFVSKNNGTAAAKNNRDILIRGIGTILVKGKIFNHKYCDIYGKYTYETLDIKAKLPSYLNFSMDKTSISRIYLLFYLFFIVIHELRFISYHFNAFHFTVHK